MSFRQLIGRCLPRQIQFKRESAHFALGANWGYVPLGHLCQSCDVVEGSSKPLATHCQNRYPSPNGWSDHTRVRPPTPFGGANGRVNAGFGQKSPQCQARLARVWETIPCSALIKVANLWSSGAHKSGDHICSTHSKSLQSLQHPLCFLPARVRVSNAPLWGPSAGLWPLRFWTPTWPVAHCLAVWLGQPVTRPGFAPTNPRRVKPALKGCRGLRLGSPLPFRGAA